MEQFGSATRAWFEGTFDSATEVQKRGWPKIAAGEHSLLIAPTGSGKTLAAFLWCIDQLSREPAPSKEAPRGTRVVYVSPLKALAYDIERNLRAPLAGLELTGRGQVRIPTAAIRTGDTTAKERRHMLREPSDILVTTPESLYLMLGSAHRETLRDVHTVIIDEVHALAPTKRGAHLALSLERLSILCQKDPQRIGLSATARPLEVIAQFLGGDRPVSIVDASASPKIDVEVCVPVEDMSKPGGNTIVEEAESSLSPGPASKAERTHSIWPAIHPELLELIRTHQSTIVFVNSRGLCERLTHSLNELAGEPLVRSHHGSLAHGQRREIEEQLKAGNIRGIVATSSLELGIDMGAVDLVVLVESPGSVARGLQRVGRAGHHVGQLSKARIFPKHRGDLLESAVVVRKMRAAELEPLTVPQNPLDVLAQQVVATCIEKPIEVEKVATMFRRAASYRNLPDSAFLGVLDMLSGRYPSNAFADLRPRLNWDRASDVLTARPGSRMIAAMSGGTIPDRGTYAVHLGPEGPRLGELDEEMVHETVPGQTFTLGTSTWRVEEITRDRVVVSPAPGETGKLPFWHGDGPGRPLELGRAVGALVGELGALSAATAKKLLRDDYDLDELAAGNLVAYVEEQKRVTGTLPTDRSITIERFRDELGDWRICILSPFGARIHAPWAMALAAKLSSRAGFEIQTLWSDDGIVLRYVDDDEIGDLNELVPSADEVNDLLVGELGGSALFASQFRENAARSLLLPRRRPDQRTPLWAQRLKSQQLLAVAREYPSFPVVMETYRSCLQDVFDVAGFEEILQLIERREIRIELVETPAPSPFATSLVFAYVATYLYAGDSPLAERRAQALSLDRRLLAELLGATELRELLDPEVLELVEQELQRRADDRRAANADSLHDMLRSLGDLDAAEVAERADGPSEQWLERLRAERRVVEVKVAGVARFIAAEDVAVYRDALGCQPPQGLAAAFLEPAAAPTTELIARYARTHSPFVVAEPAERFGISRDVVENTLAALEARDQVVRGNLRPGGHELEWCDRDVLRRIKRRTLARLRDEVEPVEPSTLARFLPAWHGIGGRPRGMSRLEEVLVQLEGLPVPYSELETTILPARVPDFSPRMLDELGAMGWLVWIGRGSLGTGDGRVALYRRDRIAGLQGLAERPEDLGDLHQKILDYLGTRGACFARELQSSFGPVKEEELREALWDLVWHGLVTNDTFQPLRATAERTGRPRPRPHRARQNADARLAGRWSLVSELLGGPETATDAAATERAHALAVMLLERHGIVTREVAALEHLPGGFTAQYRVLRAMEEAGKVRRGYFIEGLGGAQFAFAGAVDRLRALRDPPRIGADEERRAILLCATDPANAYGWLLPWPERPASAPAPRRAAGTSVVLVDGELVLYLEKGGRGIVTFAAAKDEEVLLLALRALEPIARRNRGKLMRVERIDGQPARTSLLAPLLHRAQFTADHRGLVLEVRVA